jgi:prepilin-type N-terminal cleavage/methylation domain-containing protein
MKRYTKGFTLIELLVVIAIIGILASVVLVSLQSARKKGSDARVMSAVQQIRTSLETSTNGSSYPDLVIAGAPHWYSARPTNATGSTGGNIDTLVGDILSQQTSAGITSGWGINQSVVITKDTDSPATKGYAIYAKLPSDPTKAFCIDGNGSTKTTTFPANEVNSVAAATNCQ